MCLHLVLVISAYNLPHCFHCFRDIRPVVFMYFCSRTEMVRKIDLSTFFWHVRSGHVTASMSIIYHIASLLVFFCCSELSPQGPKPSQPHDAMCSPRTTCDTWYGPRGLGGQVRYFTTHRAWLSRHRKKTLVCVRDLKNGANSVQTRFAIL